ncbi:MAG: hypothetical protein EAZ08_08025 [Cytophagales bacterium]|nr:MAG: hypothetical protein EAZ08_08025 [Cytophagales bacterium]
MFSKSYASKILIFNFKSSKTLQTCIKITYLRFFEVQNLLFEGTVFAAKTVKNLHKQKRK